MLARHGLTGGGHAMGGRQGDEGRETERRGRTGAVPAIPEKVVEAPPEQLSLL